VSQTDDESTTISGDGVRIVDALVQRKMLQLWLRAGLRPSRHWTPTRAVLHAGRTTSVDFPRGTTRARAIAAVSALEEWVREQRPGFDFSGAQR
jgi:hypothetical protein